MNDNAGTEGNGGGEGAGGSVGGQDRRVRARQRWRRERAVGETHGRKQVRRPPGEREALGCLDLMLSADTCRHLPVRTKTTLEEEEAVTSPGRLIYLVDGLGYLV